MISIGISYVLGRELLLLTDLQEISYMHLLELLYASILYIFLFILHTLLSK